MLSNSEAIQEEGSFIGLMMTTDKTEDLFWDNFWDAYQEIERALFASEITFNQLL